MNIYIFLKVFAELSLYFSFISGISGLFSYTFPPLWPMLFCSCAAAIAAFVSDHGKSGVRFVCLIFPVCCLTFAAGVMDTLVLMPCIIYTGFTVVRDEWDLEYFHFREFFRKALTVLGIFLLVLFFGSMLEDSTRQSKPLLNSTAALRYSLIYTVIGILLQRQLRIGTDAGQSKYVSNLQMTLVSLSTGLILLAILGAERYLASQGISLGNLIGEALRFIVGLPVYLLGFLVTLVMGLDGKVLEKIESSQTVETQPGETNPLPEMGEAVIPPQQEVVVNFPWWLVILLLAAATFGLILLTRTLRSRPTGAALMETVEKLVPAAKQSRSRQRSNRQKIRRIYRDYLKAEQSRGHKLHPWHTSQDILEDMRSGIDRNAAESLRKVYLAARYDTQSKVSPEQVQSARESLRKLQ